MKLQNLIMILTVLIATSITIFSWPDKNSEPLSSTNKNSEAVIINKNDENEIEKQTAILLPEYPKKKFQTRENWKWGRRIEKSLYRKEMNKIGNASWSDGKIIRRKPRKKKKTNLLKD